MIYIFYYCVCARWQREHLKMVTWHWQQYNNFFFKFIKLTSCSLPPSPPSPPQKARTGIVMNIIGILCITLAINSWGKAMFELDSFPAWANATGVWARLGREEMPTQLPFLPLFGCQTKHLWSEWRSHCTTRLWWLLDYEANSTCFLRHLSSARSKGVAVRNWWENGTRVSLKANWNSLFFYSVS